MKHILFFSLIALFFLFELPAKAGDPLPSVDLRDLHGQRVDLKEYAENDKVTIIAFWATWCSPCRQELNNIYLLLPEWEEKYNVEFLAVSVDNSRTIANVEPYVHGRGWDFDVLLDENEDTKRALNFSNIPYSIVVDNNGNIVYTHSGYADGDEYKLEDFLIELTAGAQIE